MALKAAQDCPSTALAENRLLEAQDDDSFQSHSGVNKAVNDVDQNDHKNKERAVKHGGSHNDSVIKLLHGLYKVSAQAGNREDEFHHKAARGNCRNLRA